MERFLCRLRDPLEYEEGMPAAEWFQHEINDRLEYEGFAISYPGGGLADRAEALVRATASWAFDH